VLALFKTTGILSPRGFIFGRSFDAAAVRSEAKRGEARRGEALAHAAKLPACTRVTKLENARAFLYHTILQRVLILAAASLITVLRYYFTVIQNRMLFRTFILGDEGVITVTK